MENILKEGAEAYVRVGEDDEYPYGLSFTGTVKEVKEGGGPDDPYLVKRVVIEATAEIYNPDYGDDRICECGHPYYRHFDTYENMSPVGCKYCGCSKFKEKRLN